MTPQTPVLRVALVGLASLAIAMGIGRFAYTPLLPLMQDDGLIDISDGGLLASVHFLGYLMGAVWAARLPGAPRTVFRLSLVAIGVATLGMGLTENLGVWLGLRWLAGLCSAFVLVLVGNYTISHLAEAGRPGTQGWVFSGVGAGIAFAGLGVLGFMIGGVGSAPGWQIFGAASLAAILVLCLATGPEIPGTPVARRRRESPRTPLVRRLVIAYGAAGIGYVIPATWLPVMAREIVESPIIFGWSWPVFGAAAFLSTPLVAGLQRRFGNRRVWAVSQFVMAAGLLLPVVWPHIVSIIVAGVCVGGTFMIITMMGLKEAHRIAPANDVMRHIGAMTAAFATGQMIGPVFASALHELTGGFAASLVATSAILAATAASLLLAAPVKQPSPSPCA